VTFLVSKLCPAAADRISSAKEILFKWRRIRVKIAIEALA